MKFVFTGSALILGFFLQAQKPLSGDYELVLHLGHLSPVPDSVYFSYYNTTTKKRLYDSAAVSQGQAIFKGSIDEPILVQLKAQEKAQEPGKRAKSVYPRDYYNLYLEPGTIQLTAADSLGNATVTGSAAHLEYLQLKAAKKTYDLALDHWNDLYDQYEKSNDAAGKKKAEQAIDSIEGLVREKVYKPYINTHTDKTPVVLYALTQYAGYDINADSVEPLFNKIDLIYRSLPSGKDLEQRIELAKEIVIGRPAIDFTQTDTSGKPVTLSSFRGKYVLIDFWASWCGPCRAENPNVVKAYRLFSQKNFTIIGVSLDRPGQKEKWLKAIHDDQLSWNQVSDLQFWNNAVARRYGIMAIPQNILVDPSGIIIARNLEGEQLKEKLGQLLN